MRGEGVRERRIGIGREKEVILEVWRFRDLKREL